MDRSPVEQVHIGGVHQYAAFVVPLLATAKIGAETDKVASSTNASPATPAESNSEGGGAENKNSIAPVEKQSTSTDTDSPPSNDIDAFNSKAATMAGKAPQSGSLPAKVSYRICVLIKRMEPQPQIRLR